VDRHWAPFLPTNGDGGPEGASVGIVSRWLLPLSTAGFVMAGILKDSPALASFPVDLTLALAAITSLGVLVALVRTTVPNQLPVIVAAFALLLPAALLASGSEYAVEKVKLLFTLTLLSVLAPVVLARSRADAERHVWAWTLLAGIVAGSSILNPIQSGEYEGAPLTAEGADTIDLGMSAGVVFLVMMISVLWKRIHWLLALPIAGAATFALLQSGSRGPLISAILGIISTILLVRTRPNPLRSLTVVGLGAMLLVMAYQAAPYHSQIRIRSLILEGRLAGTASTREEYYDAAWELIRLYPLGTGFGGFERVGLGDAYPHNLPLEVLSEAGLVLGTLFLCWIAVEIWKGRAATTDFASCAAFALTVHTLVIAFFSGDLHSTRTFFYALGLLIAVRGVASQNLTSRPVVQ
jgi:O-antigen ligase